MPKNKTGMIRRRTPRALAQEQRQMAYALAREQREFARQDSDFAALRSLSGENYNISRLFLTGWAFNEFPPPPPDTERGLLEMRLHSIELEATETLQKDLPPGVSDDLQVVDKNKFFKRRVLNNSQIDALAVLAHSAKLKELLSRIGYEQCPVLPSPATGPLIEAACELFTPGPGWLVMKKNGRWSKWRPPPLQKPPSSPEMAAQIACEAMRLAWAAIKGDLRKNLWPNIKYGAAFRYGPKTRRGGDKLTQEMARVLQTKGFKFQAKDMWADFKKRALSGDELILQVTDRAIRWRGRKAPTSYKSFLNRFSRIKEHLD
jgi:hypothetical protein